MASDISLQAPFMRMERKMEDLTGDCGILKKVLRTGIGHVIPEQCIIRGNIIHVTSVYVYIYNIIYIICNYTYNILCVCKPISKKV